MVSSLVELCQHREGALENVRRRKGEVKFSGRIKKACTKALWYECIFGKIQVSVSAV